MRGVLAFQLGVAKALRSAPFVLSIQIPPWLAPCVAGTSSSMSCDRHGAHGITAYRQRNDLAGIISHTGSLPRICGDFCAFCPRRI